MVEKSVLDKKLEAFGWGLFFVWVGIALLLDVGWGIGLLGVGAITLGGQGARQYLGLQPEGFWIVVGALFLLGGILHLIGAEEIAGPAVLVVVGAALLFAALRHK
jgi:hypothetical protein